MGWGIPGFLKNGSELNFWCNWEGQGTLHVTVHSEAEREIRLKTPCMGGHDCIHKNCSEFGQAVNEGAKSSSPAKNKLAARLWDTREQHTACSPGVTPCSQGTEQDSVTFPGNSWSGTWLQSFVSTENYPGTLTVWSVRGGSTICFSILFKTNFQSSFKTRFRTVFSQIFAETLKLE